jgi:hypothetical protein
VKELRVNGKEKIGPYDKYCTEVSVPNPTSKELALKVNLKNATYLLENHKNSSAKRQLDKSQLEVCDLG